jgi:hypothetical protein
MKRRQQKLPAEKKTTPRRRRVPSKPRQTVIATPPLVAEGISEEVALLAGRFELMAAAMPAELHVHMPVKEVTALMPSIIQLNWLAGKRDFTETRVMADAIEDEIATLQTKKPRPTECSTDPNDPPFWPTNLSREDKLKRLELLAPDKVKALDLLLDVALRDSWPWQKGGAE